MLLIIGELRDINKVMFDKNHQGSAKPNESFMFDWRKLDRI